MLHELNSVNLNTECTLYSVCVFYDRTLFRYYWEWSIFCSNTKGEILDRNTIEF